MDAQGQEGVGIGVGEPELVAVHPPGHPIVAGAVGEGLPGVRIAGERVTDPRGRRHLLAGQGHPAVRIEAAEPGEVPQGRIDPSVEHSHTVLIGGDEGVAFGADPRPQQTRHQRLHALAGDLLAHPAEDVGLTRAVLEGPAVIGLRLKSGEEVIHPDARGLPLRLGPADRLLDLPDLGLRVEVVLGEPDARAHVEDVAHARPGIAGGGELGNVVGDRASRIEIPGADEVAGDGADE